MIDTYLYIKQHSITGLKYQLVVCPHCGKEGGGGAMKQWHFDNCKDKGSLI